MEEADQQQRPSPEEEDLGYWTQESADQAITRSVLFHAAARHPFYHAVMHVFDDAAQLERELLESCKPEQLALRQQSLQAWQRPAMLVRRIHDDAVRARRWLASVGTQ